MYVAIQAVRFGTHDYDGTSLATSMDWKTQDGVTPVENQEECGWALSTTGALEDAWALRTGSPTSLSEQQLVDCGSTCSG